MKNITGIILRRSLIGWGIISQRGFGVQEMDKIWVKWFGNSYELESKVA